MEESYVSSTIKVAIATPLDPGLRHLLTEVDPSVEIGRASCRERV